MTTDRRIRLARITERREAIDALRTVLRDRFSPGALGAMFDALPEGAAPPLSILVDAVGEAVAEAEEARWTVVAVAGEQPDAESEPGKDDWPDVPNWRDLRTGTMAAWTNFARRHGIHVPPGASRSLVALRVQGWLGDREARRANDE